MQQFFTWFSGSSSPSLANSWCYDLVQLSPLLGPSFPHLHCHTLQSLHLNIFKGVYAGDEEGAQ